MSDEVSNATSASEDIKFPQETPAEEQPTAVDYDAQKIRILTCIEAVRARPGMYLGDTNQRGISHMLYECAANVFDLQLQGKATSLDIRIDGTTFHISDDGPGMPFDQPSETPGISKATHYLTNYHNTPTADHHAPHIHLALHGVGICVVNALSSSFEIRSWRNGVLWEQHFAAGVALGPPRSTPNPHGVGTHISFTLDPSIFGDTKPDIDAIKERFTQTCHLFPELHFTIQGEHPPEERGLVYLAHEPPYPYNNESHTDHEDHDGSDFFAETWTEDEITYNVVAFGNLDKDERDFTQRSWANGVENIEHGDHMFELNRALVSIRWRAKERLIHVVMHNPRFAGPTMTKLSVPRYVGIMRESITKRLQRWRGEIHE